MWTRSSRYDGELPSVRPQFGTSTLSLSLDRLRWKAHSRLPQLGGAWLSRVQRHERSTSHQGLLPALMSPPRQLA
ncbi:uncharacterized protein LACBIDRAFT_301515 [Laccaria bicolor S238N-H82]|uniref:Predicted protein n=1 Tax=Laccaria bicolor (strain S238N-H82 / ATCC MYA-4686) TaxID=486041 RepID=B0CNQ2_LACBS|nr:uncharacterized protein LACBIDRAFT_301515 [Laccaria bicolor S238N-H82]EDR15339.1 predicted protein [Laccaria bicolor S238N-H82]|eukprot:XP_001873547.1 predicted protein [Laccaria bicolor S238N-H82]